VKHFILDFETMGTNVYDCAVVDCSFLVFDTDKMLSANPYTTKSIVDIKKSKLSVKKQIDNYGWKVYSDTIKFWQEQSKEVQKLVSPKSTDITVEEFSTDLFNMLNQAGKISYWWSRSSSFDPLILWRMMDQINMGLAIKEHLPHWKQRDTRTFIDAKLNFPKINGFVPISDEDFWEKVFQEHNSAWDVLADTLRIQAIMRAEADLQMVQR
jgi:hypothetical protein